MRTEVTNMTKSMTKISNSSNKEKSNNDRVKYRDNNNVNSNNNRQDITGITSHFEPPKPKPHDSGNDEKSE